MGKVLDSVVKELKEKGLDSDPIGLLLIEISTYYADDPKFESLVEKVITEASLCTCEYYRSHPLLHGEQCPIRTLSHNHLDTLH